MDDHDALELSVAAVLADAVTDSSVGWCRATDTLRWTPDTIQSFTYHRPAPYTSLDKQLTQNSYKSHLYGSHKRTTDCNEYVTECSIIDIRQYRRRQSYRHADPRQQQQHMAVAARVTSNRATVTVFVTMWLWPIDLWVCVLSLMLIAQAIFLLACRQTDRRWTTVDSNTYRPVGSITLSSDSWWLAL